MSIGLVVKKHVSQWCYASISAYVCGERGGLILEDPYKFGWTTRARGHRAWN